MAIPIGDAHDINTVLYYLMGRRRPHGAAVTADEVTAAASRLAGKAHKALGAGLAPDDVDLTGALATAWHDGAPPAEIDGMDVRAAFPTPPPDEDSMEHWTLILAEPPSADGSTYRLCRVRRAGAPGEWEVIDSLTGAEDLIWMVAADWFARAVRVEAGGDEPLQEDRPPPR
jgi:hypothetical protein